MRFILLWASLSLATVGVESCHRRADHAETAPPELRGTAADGGDLVGLQAPEWDISDWINSPPLTLASLRGHVLFIRWFTDTDCPYCTATAPALNQFHADFGNRGLTVIGFYHHKRPEPLDLGKVRAWSAQYGFHFPVGVDRDWRTLRRWWLNGNRDFTSVSFLIDQKGIVRAVHPGGRLALGSADYRAIRTSIESLLGIQPPPPSVTAAAATPISPEASPR